MTIRFALAAMVLAGLALPSAAQDRIATVTQVYYPGQQIAADHIRIVPVRKPLRDGKHFARDMDDVAGKVARRTILAGRAIDLRFLGAAHSVEAGALVRVAYRSAAITITLTATALADAAPGESVRLRNPQSGRTVTGTAQADGTVIVDGGAL